MIKSMTAYAEKSRNVDGLAVSLEIRTYNSRYLDFVFRLPGSYRYLENTIKQWVAERIGRGRVEIVLAVTDERSASAPLFQVDYPRAQAYYEALLALQQKLGIADAPRLELFARNEEFINPLEPEKPGKEEAAYIRDVFYACLDDLEQMRQQEGRHLAADLAARVDTIAGIVDGIRQQSADLVRHYYERLQERIAAILDGGNIADEGRLIQEAAIMADKSDISEELVRAESHIHQFRTTMAAKEPCGRKLNFLLQEFNREFNTIGAKAGLPEISKKVVEAKTELEKLREQVQNIE